MHRNTWRGTREALHLAWRSLARSARGTREGHDRDARVQGVGPLQSTEETFEQGLPRETGGEGGRKGAGQGERGPAYQGPDAEPDAPCHRCSTTYGRRSAPARHDPRQEPGAVVPHAGICAGGAG